MIKYEIVTSNGCSRCIMVKNILKQSGIPYEEHNYSTMPKYKADDYVTRAKAIGCMGLPIIIRDGMVIDMPKFLAYAKEDKNE